MQLDNELNHKFARNRWVGCYTREAMDYIIETTDLTDYVAVFFDLDGLKNHNLRDGKVKTSLRMRESVGRMPDIIGCWWSGDEFVALIPEQDVPGFMNRIMLALADQSITATFAVGPIHMIEELDAIVDAHKQMGIRGRRVY